MTGRASLKALVLVVCFVICLLIAIAYSNWWINDEVDLFDFPEYFHYDNPVVYFRFVIPLLIAIALFLSLGIVLNLTDKFRRDATFILFLWPVLYLSYHHIDRFFRVIWFILSPFTDFNASDPVAWIVVPFYFLPIDVFLGALISLIAAFIVTDRRKTIIALGSFFFNLLWALTMTVCNITYLFTAIIHS